jgi:NADH dehydrogenase FAD-containing subunit
MEHIIVIIGNGIAELRLHTSYSKNQIQKITIVSSETEFFFLVPL